MSKFQEDVKQLLKYVGGKENIQAVAHCVTRMRFVLHDTALANIKEIEQLTSVKGTFTQSGQFQVIIGNEVSEFYREFTKYAGIEGVSKDSVKSAAKSNQTILQRIMGALGEIFAPLIPAVLIAHTIVGPIGWTIGNAIADLVYGGLTSSFGVVFAAVFGLVYAPIVMTGLHHITNAIDTTLTSMFGGTILWPMIALSNIAQGSSVLAMSVLQRHDEKAQQINIPALISCYLGVTEPALFGVNLKYGFPLICGMIGSSIAAVISVGFGVQAFSIGVGGLPGIISIKSQYWLPFILAMASAIIVPFVLTLLVGKKKLNRQDITESTNTQTKAEEFQSPMSGMCMEIGEIEDQVFASKAMGEGIAIDISEGIVVAPYSGTITVAFPTKHAYGIQCDNGIELLIHIGMDTVELQGKGFTSKVVVGDHVTQGQVIAEVDVEEVKKQGKSLVSPIVFTNGTKIKILKNHQLVRVKETEMLELC